MSQEAFRFVQIVSWVAPGAIAGLYWGFAVGLLAFGAQMFSAPPLTKIYTMWRGQQGPVEVEDVQRFNILANVLCGTMFAFFAKVIVGDHTAL
jgi:hypothetical protein